MNSISVSIILLLLTAQFSTAASEDGDGDFLFANRCRERCGEISLPYPFHLNSHCGPNVDSFRLSCTQTQSSNSSLYLTLGATDVRVISFLLPSGSLLLDYSSNSSAAAPSPCDRWYADFNRSVDVLRPSSFFAVTTHNVFRLYDCDDSSVCKSGCERLGGAAAGCEGVGTYQGCCYPLADGSVWREGQGFSVFAEYGCRGFSSWVSPSHAVGHARQGIEVEWAVPWRFREMVPCAEGAVEVNATGVKGGIRCACGSGLIGDGFALGVGCFKACSEDGHSANACCKRRFCRRKLAAFVGILIASMLVVAAFATWFLLKGSLNRNTSHLDPACLPRILGKARLFSYQELHDATKGFDEEQQLVDSVDGTVTVGVIGDGSLVAVQKIDPGNEENLRQVLDIVEILAQVSHKNIARIIGCCLILNSNLLVVHEFLSHGTLEEHLRRRRGSVLGWQRRLNIATEVANAFAFLHGEISPCLNLCRLKSSEILLDFDFSTKIMGFKLLTSGIGHQSSPDEGGVCNFGWLLLELITGSTMEQISEATLQKIKDGMFDDIVDPWLGFGELLRVQRRQIGRVCGFALRCLGRELGEGQSMVGVAIEFLQLAYDGLEASVKRRPVSEVKFSSSRRLQMIHTSPESVGVL
ncbi:hypothetical protein HPP92_015072 [Vanilla planifolia]|uniref:Protein kinase domain-containing protein n=1 Tax=Vanilla planifolia TaxID=51239 RepID=A0A835UUR6_VANPL|nr:hypothetical protein HPP92_015072 [Vanilla planifolia]